LELRSFGHSAEYSFGNSTGDGGHGRDEAAIPIRGNSISHTTGDCSSGQFGIVSLARTEKRKFRAKFIEDGDETSRGSLVGSVDFGGGAIGADNEVNRTIIQMEPVPVWKKANCGGISHR
jgi:hypothetical protein